MAAKKGKIPARIGVGRASVRARVPETWREKPVLKRVTSTESSHVVAVNPEGKLLITRRTLDASRYPGHWGVPTGLVLLPEKHPKQTASRKVVSEVNLTNLALFRARGKSLRAITYFDKPYRNIPNFFLTLVKETGPVKITEKQMDKAEWYTPEELRQVLRGQHPPGEPEKRQFSTETRDALERILNRFPTAEALQKFHAKHSKARKR